MTKPVRFEISQAEDMVNQDGSSSSSSKGNAIVTETNKQKIIDPSNHKSEAKEKTISTTSAVKMKAQRKVYSLPGQRHDPPEEREPLRIFYESLYNQIPSSEMAEFWMMEHGLLSSEQAKKAYERKQKGKQKIRMGTPIKSPPVTSKGESSRKQESSKTGDIKGKKRIISESDNDDDDDFVVKLKKGKG